MPIADGEKIAIKFTQPLVGNVMGTNPPQGYKKSRIGLSDVVVTTLNQYNTSYTGAKAVDGSTSTYWRGTTAVNWIQLQLPVAKTVTQVRMFLGSYYLKTFTLSGSNDGSTWVQLGGEYTAANSSTAQWYTFAIENSESYLYYRIDTLTAYNSSRIYLYEIELYEDAPIGNEIKFVASFDEYDHVPDGTLSRVTRKPSSVTVLDPHTILLNFDPGTPNSIQRAAGEVLVAYDGTGTLMGQGGPVLAFEKAFTPVDLDPKNNPYITEHLSLSNVQVSGDLVEVNRIDTSLKEHMEISGILVTGTLTNINDL